MASSSLIISCLSAKKPPSTIPLLFPNSPPTPTTRTSSNNFFRPPPRRSKSTSFLLKPPLIKHKKHDYYSQICSSDPTPSHTQVPFVSLCFSLADLLDAIDLESTDYDSSSSSEEEEEVEEEENMMKRWTVRELEEGVELKINMPGLGKDDVKVTLEETTLLIKGRAELVVVNGDNTTADDNDMMNTIISFELDDFDFLKLNEMKAEMKNGVLKIFIPKVIEEKKEKLVVDIQVE